jgi:flagellar M-ring protein FliF
MEQIKAQIDKILQWFKALKTWQKALVIGLPSLLMILMLAIAYFGTTHYGVLFSNLDPETLRTVEYTLSRLGIEYKVDSKNGAIYVPEEEVRSLRIYLTEQGIISPDKKVGFELFENQPATVSDFVEHINYVRALEGELERTIKAISAIEDAKVNIALPRESIFARPSQEPKASVLIKLKPGRDLTLEQIKAIRNLVASSVVGLKPENVVIVDQYGRDLTALLGEDNSLVGLAQNQIQLKRKYEEELQREIERILTPIVGVGNAKVKVSLYLDFSQKKIKDYQVNPDKTAIVSQQKKKELTKTITPQGVPGTESNIPPAEGKGEAIKGISQKKESITNYEVSYVEKLIDDPTIRVRKIAVGVILNSEVKGIDPEKVKEFIINSLGLNLKRGDTVSVVELPFEGKKKLEEIFRKEEKKEGFYDWKIYLGIALLISLLLASVLFMWIRRRKEEEEKTLVYGQMLGAPSGAVEVSEKVEETLSEKLARLAKENPELYKKLLLKWLKSS